MNDIDNPLAGHPLLQPHPLATQMVTPQVLSDVKAMMEHEEQQKPPVVLSVVASGGLDDHGVPSYCTSYPLIKLSASVPVMVINLPVTVPL